MKLRALILSLLLAPCSLLVGQQTTAVQKGGAAGTNNITADLNIGTGRTLTIASGGTLTIASGATATIADGSIAWADVSKTGSSLADLTTRSATDLTSGTLPDARFPATLPALSGVNLTALNATQLTSGTVPTARLYTSAAAYNITGGAALDSWAAVTRAASFDTFTATPSSANLDSLVTDDTGSGSLVFATSPTLVTPVLGAATGTSVALSSDSIIGGTGPLQRLHIKTSTTLPGLVAGNMGHTYYGLVVESEDAILGLASRNEGGHGSGIDLMEVNSGTLADKWWIGRLASGFSPSSAFVMSYGTVADYTLATEYFKLLKTGELTLPVATQKLTVGTTTLNGTFTLGTADTSTIVIDTSDGSDNKRLSLAGGGTKDATRGGYINLTGNEYASTGGEVGILAGNVSTGWLRLFTGNATERLRIDQNGLITTPAGSTPFGNEISITNAATTGLRIRATGTTVAPILDLWDSGDASADLGRFRIVANGSTTAASSNVQIQSRTDVDGFTANLLVINRAGDLSISGTTDSTSKDTGSFITEGGIGAEKNIAAGGAFIGGVQALSGAGAISVTTAHTDFTSTGGAQALTLANGTAGQIKTISHVTDGGSGVLTPTTKTGYTTITFTNAGDSVTLRYSATGGWYIVGIFGAVAA